MMQSPLQLRPVRPGTVRGRDGDRVVYDVAYEDLAFELDGLPSDLPFGLYRLSVMTDDALAGQLSAQLDVEREGAREGVRVTAEPFPDRVDLYFVLLGDERRPVLTIAVDGPSRVTLGTADLQRVSTTRWRGRRLTKWLRARTVRPSLLAEGTRALIRDVREGGLVREMRRLTAEAVSPSIWSERRRFDQRLSRTLRQVSVVNRDLLASWSSRRTQVPASLTLVIPIFRTPRPWLAQLVASLQHQTDLAFEAVFVLDGPQDDLQAELQHLLDDRFAHRIVVLPENRGVSAATNAGIRAASGDFVLVVDHDDMLERHLVEAFRCVSAIRDADLLFADEIVADDALETVRLIASRGRFDIRHYLSHPYIVHPIFVRRALAERVGLLDETLRISHDVEFVLRCLTEARTVGHIPLSLYVWRTHATSLGHAGAEDVYANTGAAVRAYLSRSPAWSRFEVGPGINFNELEIRPPLPDGLRVAIVIPTRNGLDVLRQCLSSIYERQPANRTPADILVIDHESDDPATLRYLAQESDAGRIRLASHVGPWNYSAINNAAIQNHVSGADYTHVVLMNNDIELVTDDWLDRLAAQFSWGDVGVTGCCLLYPDGRVQHGGVVVGLTGAADHSHRFEPFLQPGEGPRSPGHLSSLVATRDYSAVTAALMMVPLPLFEAVGGLDEALAIGFNDTDFCLRIDALGYRSTYVGSVVAIHHESVTRRSNDGIDHPEDTALFLERYADLVRSGDPHYGAALDWTQTRLRSSDYPQKEFAPRYTELATGTGPTRARRDD